jgi:ribosomal protein L37AE/L43A
MEMTEWFRMTPRERLAEAGSEPPCPFCRKPRVLRSDYIRCHRCGMNWLEGQDISRHPLAKSTLPVTSTGVPPASGIAEQN